MKTIGYFGDSFCASKHPTSWCILLAQKLNMEVVNFGKGGSSIWTVFLELEHLKKQEQLPDTIFICYTEPYRLYHPHLSLAINTVLHSEKELYQASEMYYVHLQNNEKDHLAYKYALNWFDKHVLNEISKEHKIIQSWSMAPDEFTKKGTVKVKLKTGLIIEQSMIDYAFKSVGAGPGFTFPLEWENHMTIDGNKKLADKLFISCQKYLES